MSAVHTPHTHADVEVSLDDTRRHLSICEESHSDVACRGLDELQQIVRCSNTLR